MGEYVDYFEVENTEDKSFLPVTEYFPFNEYRPEQQKMLGFVYDLSRNGGIGLINAPTGSGKTSVISAALASTKGTDRPIIIMSHMVSQMEIYSDYINRIRSKLQGHNNVLAYGCIKGKQKSCNFFGEDEKNLITKCRKLCKGTCKNLINRNNTNYKQAEECPYYRRGIGDVCGRDGDRPIEFIRKVNQFITTDIKMDDINEFSQPFCAYEIMRESLKRCNIVVCSSYNYLIDPVFRNRTLGEFFELNKEGERLGLAPIIIFDEAHNLPEEISKIFSKSINQKTIDVVRDSLMKYNDDPTDLWDDTRESEVTIMLREMARNKELSEIDLDVKSANAFIVRVLVSLSNFIEDCNKRFKDDDVFNGATLIGNLNGTIPGFGYKFEKIHHYLIKVCQEDGEEDEDKLGGDVKSLNAVFNFVSELIKTCNDPSVIKCFMKKEVDEMKNDPQLKLQFIDPIKTMKSLREDSHAIILMSGTLQCSTEFGQHLFGKDQKIKEISLESTFPKENRNLLITTDCTTRYSVREQNHNTIEQYISEFVKTKANIAIFCTSYEALHRFKRYINKLGIKNVYVQAQNDHLETERILKEFRELPMKGEYGILMGVSGGKLSEGIDYIGDTLKAVMIIGVPYNKWSKLEEAKIKYYKSKFGETTGQLIGYQLPAINKSLQSLGRVIRSDTDKGLIVLCDSRFIQPDIFRHMPSWMKAERKSIRINNFQEHCLIPE